MNSEAERLRQAAAAYADLANGQKDLAEQIRTILANNNPNHPDAHRLPHDPAELANAMDNAAYRSRIVQQVAAEQARAVEAYEAAGGAGNPRARAELDATLARLNALMPTDATPGDDLGT